MVIDKMKVTEAKKILNEFKKKYKAKSYDPEEGEVEKIISGKLQERVSLQKNFRKTYLTRRFQEEKCYAMLEMIQLCDSTKTRYITWLSQDHPSEMFKANYNVELHNLSEIISQENYLKQALLNVGFSEDDIMKVLVHKEYIKDEKVLKEMEDKHVSKKLDEDDKGEKPKDGE